MAHYNRPGHEGRVQKGVQGSLVSKGFLVGSKLLM
jgi:hypothetical protein